MISRIDHVSLAVNDYDNGAFFFRNILGAVPGASGRNKEMKYFWQIFSLGDLSRFEIICPTASGSFLDNFLSKRNKGALHHISLQTPDIKKAMNVLEKNNIPYFGYNEYEDFWKEIFIHPIDAFGVLIQIAQFDPDQWLDESVKLSGHQKWHVNKTESGCTLSVANPGGGKTELELTSTEIKKLISDLEKTG